MSGSSNSPELLKGDIVPIDLGTPQLDKWLDL
jgi:hypothetical protein